MHEISLVRSIFNTLEAEFSAEELGRLNTIELQVGLLSNVEPVLMQNAFEAVTTAENKFREVSLRVNTVPIEIHCADCGVNSTISDYKFVCASCGRPNNNVVKGMELLIHRVHFDEEAGAPLT
ncbi:hydrogenase maturation nickel metallochaperone HypA/HybF [Flavilitoribacter nigricans]|uniref:Hydrogenase maturation factor HypA n=1 Tax=Flavilitoribacter nigricans (strain ATCC 23147 / DSM 23189 / NBRC 102662 / NCIMB 1420 / SS-2) TaxID=1122177 RepID=A0A2D0N5N2_FLAN2|nr:hydrogenase maturation nickel metallochaperone HypA [Flavilitoribacter nigricans]PHN03821.1 hydrogenase expression protein [Flavilitoribacter nigricans DSM 23189 = NBRC 102662]